MNEDLAECRYYEAGEEYLQCQLCPWHCRISPDKTGRCGVRKNVEGVLRSLNYAEVTSAHMDPIEKKPLYHFMPGSSILSIGTIGCNLGCKFCQNWHLSRGKSATRDLDPEEAVQIAVSEGSDGIAYTYNEPLVWYEYVYDCCKAARDRGLKNVFVTNGTLNPEPFDELLPLIDALNVDLKGDARFYKEISDSVIEPVLRNIKKAAQTAHVEVTNLVVTGQNDSAEQIGELVDFVASVNPKIPLHFSRYFPNYKFDAPATSEFKLREAFKIAREKLEFVYLGNIMIEQGRDTVCPNCETVNIQRSGYHTRVLAVDTDGRCKSCGHDLNIVTA